MPHLVPRRPSEKVGANNDITLDETRLPTCGRLLLEVSVRLLHDKTASSVITSLKSLHSIHGVPVTLFADNMPFASQQIQNFRVMWEFEIIASSPDVPQSNGQAERSSQTVNVLLKKVEVSQSDPHVAMLNYL